jgi:primosomal protein N''
MKVTPKENVKVKKVVHKDHVKRMRAMQRSRNVIYARTSTMTNQDSVCASVAWYAASFVSNLATNISQHE